MCYMKAIDPPGAGRVGVRELRQNLSVHLERVVAGEVLTVTDRGVPVAMLAPLPRAAGTVGRFVASGRATRPAGDLAATGLPRGTASRRLSAALEAQRASER
jgi:prevent-host-death family protein